MITLNMYEENEDGSANCIINMDKQDVEHLINFAVVKLLEKGIKEGEDLTPTTRNVNDEDAIVISSLKRQLVNTYTPISNHIEDEETRFRIRQCCKDLLGYYMIPSEAESYIKQIESIHE